jgi:hypothetical protein
MLHGVQPSMRGSRRKDRLPKNMDAIPQSALARKHAWRVRVD